MNYEFTAGYKIRDQFGLFFMTFTIVDWIDLFSRKLYRDILIKTWSIAEYIKGFL